MNKKSLPTLLVIPLGFALLVFSYQSALRQFSRPPEVTNEKQPEPVAAAAASSSDGVPVFDSVAHDACRPENNKDLASFCKDVVCMEHNKDVDSVYDQLLEKEMKRADGGESCRMLWFAGLYEGDQLYNALHKGQSSYNTQYTAALKSAIDNAFDSLQPVLMLGRYLTDYQNSTEHRKLGKWAEANGAKVVYSPKMSFQDDILRGLPGRGPAMTHGQWLRLDIPKFIKEHKLFDMPGICPDHVFYTDVDVIFSNRLTPNHMQALIRSMGDGMLSYGRQFTKEAQIANDGVMLVDVAKFEAEVPKIIAYAKEMPQYPVHEQVLLNAYMAKHDKDRALFKLSPMHFNWKPYWRLEPSSFSQVQIVHFHGPKVGRGLEEMSVCDVEGMSKSPDYITKQGACCDSGRTAAWSIKAEEYWRARAEDIFETGLVRP